VPFDKEMGYRVVEVLKAVADRRGTSPARVALSWVLGRPAISSVIVALEGPAPRPVVRLRETYISEAHDLI
jgi:aryl-alcohol dehydrogenase-like predicted oxidoreductase